jgi:hypothetical protein
MSQSKVPKSANFSEHYAEYVNIAPAAIDSDLVNLMFITNKFSPSVFGQMASDEQGKTDFQIGAVGEITHECSIMMSRQQLEILKETIDSFLKMRSEA